MKNRIFPLQLALFCAALVAISAVPSFAEDNLADVRFLGNFNVSNDEIIRLGGIEIGSPVTPASLGEIEKRLLRSGRFEKVAISKRYRSISAGNDVILVVTVKEKEPAASKFMFMPILKGSDEYGLTYGLRSTAKDILGFKERLSVPLTWGGERRAAIEGEFNTKNLLMDTIFVSAGVSRKKNPYYKIGDFRKGVRVESRRRLNRFQASVQSGWTGVDFGLQRANMVQFGAGLVWDTRQNVNLPRDAFYAGVFWERDYFTEVGSAFNRWTLDFRGYKGIIGQSILAAQFLLRSVDGRLPDFERPFLGGADTLRGYEPGTFIGDSIVTSSVEFRVPLTSPRNVYHAGIHVFLDSGTVYDHGTSIGNADFRHGAGLGAFFLILGYGIKADLAYNMHDSFRLHFSMGFRF